MNANDLIKFQIIESIIGFDVNCSRFKLVGGTIPLFTDDEIIAQERVEWLKSVYTSRIFGRLSLDTFDNPHQYRVFISS